MIAYPEQSASVEERVELIRAEGYGVTLSALPSALHEPYVCCISLGYTPAPPYVATGFTMDEALRKAAACLTDTHPTKEGA